MKDTIKKICLGVIYIGTAAILFAPLLIDNDYFFPFISTRVFIFRPAVEIMLAAYLLLNVVDEKYRPRLGKVGFLIAAMVVVGFASSLLGNDFGRSFWGDMERGEGLILWLHLLAMFMVLSGTFQDKKKLWLRFMDFSIGVSIILGLFGLAQVFKLPFVLSTSGSRVDATFGNAAFFATYLLFHAAFAIFLLGQRRQVWAKIYYSAASLLFIYLMFATETRGSVIGLAAGLLFGSILFAIKKRDNVKVKRFSLSAIVLILGIVTAAYFLRDTDFVQNSPRLRRMTSISLSERTAETRLATWKAAFSGWKEKFVLGYGMENFQEVFNKHFPPIIYEDEGSQVWFDRAHNIVFDRAATTGIVGLIVFLLILGYPLYYFLRKVARDSETQQAAIIFSSFLIAYLAQDLFIFESINIYIILFFTLAFWSAVYFQAHPVQILQARKAWIGAFAVYLLAFAPLMWKVNIEPAKYNLAASDALHSNPQEEDFFLIVERFKQAIEHETYGTQEYRIQFIEFIDGQLANLGEVRPEVKPVLEYTDRQVDKQVAEGPTDAKSFLLAMRHYNYTFASLPDQRERRLFKALEYFGKLQELTPTRPHIYQEAGYTNVYLFRYYRDLGDISKAQVRLVEAEEFFKKTIALQPKVRESYLNLVMLHLNAGQFDKILPVLEEMDKIGINWRNEATLGRLLDLSKANQNFPAIALFAEESTKINESNITAWTDLALAYAYMDNKVKAREAANHIKTFGPDYEAQADAFLRNLEANVYRDQAR